jgi:peptidoglycan hydrolase-like protein with peptidoglycan-binding domain
MKSKFIFVLALVLGLTSCNILFADGFGNYFTDITNAPTNVPLPPPEPITPGILPADAPNCYNGFCKDTSNSCSVSLFFTRELREGDSGIDVIALQDLLISERYLKLKAGQVKGYFGPATTQALKKYQDGEGTDVTGYLDTSLINKLNESVVSGETCLTYVRYDSLKVAFKKGLNIKGVVKQFNALGFTGVDKDNFCPTNIKSNSCVNIFNYKPFTLYMPSHVSVTKAATYFASLKAFDKISYIPVTADVESELPELFVKVEQRIDTSTTTTKVTYSTTTIPYTEYNSTATTTRVEYTIPLAILANNPTQVDVNKAIIATRAEADEYLYGTWKLVKINGSDLNAPFGQKPVLVTFVKQDGGRVGINACNKATSTAEIYGNVISARLFPSTEFYCNAMLDGNEKLLKDAFNATSNYDINGPTYGASTLTVINAATSQKFEFVRNY